MQIIYFIFHDKMLILYFLKIAYFADKPNIYQNIIAIRRFAPNE